MKKIKIYSSLLLLTIFMACTQDTEIVTEEQYNLTQEINKDQKNGSFTVDILIQWRCGLTEPEKEVIRDRYIGKDILNWYQLCKDECKETWNINCEDGKCNRDSDTPVETDDEVERISLYQTCISI